jgi:hypothetical protein
LVLRNALEPIMYKFLSRILDRLEADSEGGGSQTPVETLTLQSAFEEAPAKKKANRVITQQSVK